MDARRIAAWLVALAMTIAVCAGAADRAGAPSRGTVGVYRMAAPSLRDPQRRVRVYLPASYARPEARARTYPVVFLLHGWPGGDGNWLGEGHAEATLDSLIAAGRIPAIIAVMPSAAGVGLLGRSMYVNTYDGSSRMEDFVVRDLVAWTDATFRTRRGPASRALIGLSEGGSAAINLCFKHPDVFGACGSHSGDFVLTRGMGERRILGPEPGATALLEANSPLHYAGHRAPALRRLTIYFDCGLDDTETEENRSLDRLLTRLGVPHEYHEFPGTHGWGYWRKHLRDSLVAVTAHMRADRP